MVLDEQYERDLLTPPDLLTRIYNYTRKAAREHLTSRVRPRTSEKTSSPELGKAGTGTPVVHQPTRTTANKYETYSEKMRYFAGISEQ
jgi:hypothetical protein